MKNILLIMLLVMAVCVPVASAEIRTYQDEFDGTFYIRSETYEVGKFGMVSLIKGINKNKAGSMYLRIYTRSLNPSLLEKKAAVMDIDGTMHELDCFSAGTHKDDGMIVADSGYLVSNKMADIIKNANHIKIQIFLLREKPEIFDVTPEMLAEWKKVINT